MTSASEFWIGQFEELDVALPRYDTSRTADWNKVMNHYRAVGLKGRHAGRPAHWYQEYRAG